MKISQEDSTLHRLPRYVGRYVHNSNLVNVQDSSIKMDDLCEYTFVLTFQVLKRKREGDHLAAVQRWPGSAVQVMENVIHQMGAASIAELRLYLTGRHVASSLRNRISLSTITFCEAAWCPLLKIEPICRHEATSRKYSIQKLLFSSCITNQQIFLCNVEVR